jgi:Na+/proline symporter
VGLAVLFQLQPPSPPPRTDGEFIAFINRELPHGLIGLVVAAIFSAAMSTLSGSLNSSAAATVNDLYRPLAPHADERRLMRLSRSLTAFWGLAQIGVAFAAIQLQDNVVVNALAIASYVTGIVLGVFLLGTLTRSVGQPAALTGLVAGLAVVTAVKFLTPIAWPWYALIGSTTVFGVGWLVQRALWNRPPASVPIASEP